MLLFVLTLFLSISTLATDRNIHNNILSHNGKIKIPIKKQSNPIYYFSLNIYNNSIVVVQEGTTALLHCQTDSKSTVLWKKKESSEILTKGLLTSSSDKRFSVSNLENANDWSLQIKYTRDKDKGVYECIHNNTGHISYRTLEIVRSYSKIIGANPKIVKEGSPLRLSCVLQRSIQPPVYIFWYHGDRMINYDLDDGATVRHGRQGSELIFPRAESYHSGNYSCVPSNSLQASVTVTVT